MARVLGALVVLALLGSGCRIPGDAPSGAPADLDALADHVGTCGSDEACPHLVYVTSPSMPLSELGIPEISRAAAALGVPLSVVAAEDVESSLTAEADETRRPNAGRAEGHRALASSIVSAGATLHYPSVVLFDGPMVRGPAVLGYKRAEGYQRLLASRVSALRASATVRSAEGSSAGAGS